MATQEQSALTCGVCGAKIAADLRYCIQCYAPVGTGVARPHVELARQTATTHRPDPTIVFSPEKHEAIVRHARSRKRLIIISAIVLVVAVGSTVAIQMVNSHRREVEKVMARELAAERDLNTLSDALERFRGDVGRYPTNEEGLTGLARRPAAFPADNDNHAHYWFGPYLDHVPEVDPWGNDYLYKTPDGGRSFQLTSDGPADELGSGSRFRVTSQSSTESVQ